MTDDNTLHQEDISTMNSSLFSNTSSFQSTNLFLFANLADDHGFLLDDTTDWVLRLLIVVIFGLVCGSFGTVTNIINIFIFVKQGLFSGGSVINLFFLAIADLGVTLTYFAHGIGFAIMVANVPNLPIAPFSIIYLGMGWPHTIFTKINRMLTAFVAFERCMCVVIPFRVKNIFAPRRCLIYLLTIFAYGFLSHLPVYLTHSLGEVKQKGTNVTVDLVYGTNREFWHDVVYYGNFLALSFLTTLIVIVCTVITGAYIRTSKEWRNKMSGINSTVVSNKTASLDKNKSNVTSEEPDKKDKQKAKKVVDKEARLVKMITTISAIFCICYIPELFLIVLSSVDKRVNTTGQYERLSGILYSLTFFSASINSSINIFVYYRMSSKYRQIFLAYFSAAKEKS